MIGILIFMAFASPAHYADGQRPKKIKWDDEFVEEVAHSLNACAVFCFFPFFWLCYSQIDGNLGTVAAGMTLDGSPNDLIQCVFSHCVIQIPLAKDIVLV